MLFNFKMRGGFFSFCFLYETVFGNGQQAITHNSLIAETLLPTIFLTFPQQDAKSPERNVSPYYRIQVWRNPYCRRLQVRKTSKNRRKNDSFKAAKMLHLR